MFGPGRRVARRTARRTTRRQMAISGAMNQPEEPQQEAAPPAPAAGDYTAELEQLAKLKAEGILSEEEFQAKKKQILGI